MSVRWTREAQLQLVNIRSYIAKDNPAAAREQIKRIIFHAESLKNKPLLGRIVPELGDAKIREVLERPYRIIYTEIADVPWILTVWHYRRLLKSDNLRL